VNPHEFATEWRNSPHLRVRLWGWVRWVADSAWSAMKVQPGPGERLLLRMLADGRPGERRWAKLRGNGREWDPTGRETWVRTMNAQIEEEPRT
jgi:hypothetical protein